MTTYIEGVCGKRRHDAPVNEPSLLLVIGREGRWMVAQSWIDASADAVSNIDIISRSSRVVELELGGTCYYV